MCKLLIIVGSLSARQTRLALLQSSNQFACQKDGFGFMASNGKTVARGRYLDGGKFAGFMADLPKWLTGEQSEENKMPANVNSLIVHGRTSTNVKTLFNVHPFQHKGFYLAHNGVVSFTGKDTEKPLASCDSEQFLHWLVDSGNWKDSTQAFSGWGSIALYDAKTHVLTVARSMASLHIARRVKSKGWVIGTSADDIRTICKVAGIALLTPVLTFPDKLIVQFQAGKAITDQVWQGFGSRVWTMADNVASGKADKTLAKAERRNRKVYKQYWDSIKPVSTVTPEQSHNAMFPDWEGKDVPHTKFLP